MSLAIDTSDLKPSRGGGGAGEGDKLTQVIDHSNKFLHNYPLVIQCSLGQDERKEATDVVVAALETTTDYLHTKVAAQIKTHFDNNFGAVWHVVVGERFSSCLSHEQPSLLYMYSGSLAVLAWKAGNMLHRELLLTYKQEEKTPAQKSVLKKKKLF